ncbi:hypothetical protein D3C87_445830 [compost metagenome]
MKTLLLLTLSLLATATSWAGTPLTPATDIPVSPALLEDLKVVSSKDERLSARLASVYRGTAYGVTSIVVTLVDHGPTEGDYANTNSYELVNFTTYPKDIKLIKIESGEYELIFSAGAIESIGDDGMPVYTTTTMSLLIRLNKNGSVISVER